MKRFSGFAIPLILSLVLASGKAQAASLRYDVEITPNLKTQTVRGKVSIELESQEAEKSFPLNGLEVDRVRVNGDIVVFRVEQQKIWIPLSRTTPSNRTKKIQIEYHGKPRLGIVFGSNYVYTAFSTCHWMICDEEPSAKAQFSLDIIVPATFKTVGSGRFIKQAKEQDGLVRHSWREDRPHSSYLFGFAAGQFHEAFEKVGSAGLRYFGVSDDSEALIKKFGDTGAMLSFFESKAGVPYPHATYTQVLVPGYEAQEVSSFSVLGKTVVDPILKNPQEDWGIGHELAHQWWGNLLTCQTWQHFWLNEGITVFMVAAYKERRWGRVAYENEMSLIKKRYQRAIDANLDVPLTYDGKYPNIQLKRDIVYSKGAIFMDTLRKEMGEDAFWKGLKTYTQKFQGQLVVSVDFQLVMESAVGRKLDSIFQKWVY